MTGPARLPCTGRRTRTRCTRGARRLADEAGLGGVEALPLLVLVFVVVVLFVVNVWSVVDGKLAVQTAAREAARTYVETAGTATSPAAADDAADAAARAALASGGRLDAGRYRLAVLTDGDGVDERCERITAVVSYDVPTIRLPGAGALGGSLVTVTARHTELVDPYRSGLAGAAQCGA